MLLLYQTVHELLLATAELDVPTGLAEEVQVEGTAELEVETGVVVKLLVLAGATAVVDTAAAVVDEDQLFQSCHCWADTRATKPAAATKVALILALFLPFFLYVRDDDSDRRSVYRVRCVNERLVAEADRGRMFFLERVTAVSE